MSKQLSGTRPLLQNEIERGSSALKCFNLTELNQLLMESKLDPILKKKLSFSSERELTKDEEMESLVEKMVGMLDCEFKEMSDVNKIYGIPELEQSEILKVASEFMST
jgi:hypothetical protein